MKITLEISDVNDLNDIHAVINRLHEMLIKRVLLSDAVCLDSKTIQILQDMGIVFLNTLIGMSENDLLKIDGITKKSLQAIKESLRIHGL